ncbi:MAG: DUF3267 domain-containing protein [Planctomycetaceae bacterium]|nr:DUF3267 domain-containing protein [Planctomycetaceae bacterium]
MRFVLGPIPPSETFAARALDWTPMISSNELRWANVTSVVGLLLFLVAGCLCLQRAAFSPDVEPWLLVGAIVLTAVLIPLHEFFHCLGYLVPLHSRKLITGIWLARGIWYVVYDSPLPRGRVLLMLAAPFLFLSCLPCLAFPFLSGSRSWLLGYVVLMHVALCVGDAITFFRIGVTIPKGALIQNCGWKTYWSPLPIQSSGSPQS